MRAVFPLVLAALMQDAQAAQTIDIGDLGDFDLGDLLGGLGGAGGGGGGGQKKKGPPAVCPGKTFPAPKVALHLTDNLRANGCGPQGMQVDDEYGLSKCCNAHDICYSFCGTPFDWCEEEFQSCLKKVCNAHEDPSGCKETADGFSGLTKIFGSGFWKKAQKNTCECMNSKQAANERYLETMADFYAFKAEKLGEDASDPRKSAEKALRKWKGKEGKLQMTLGLKYGVDLEFVKFDDVEAVLPDPSSVQKRKKEPKLKEEL